MKHLEVRNLTKIFHMHILGGKKITAFENISFTLQHGQFLGIAGKSGYGKSSLIRCIYRNYNATSGDVLLYDHDGKSVNLIKISDHDMLQIRKNRIGYVSQFFQSIPRVTTMDIIIEPLIDQNWSIADAKERAANLFHLFDIPENLWDAYPSTFSGGEKQRINLARTLIDSPELLLLDEPTASLDKKNRRIIINILKKMKHQGISMIGIFHDPEELDELSDVSIVMEKKEQDTTEESVNLQKNHREFEFKI